MSEFQHGMLRLYLPVFILVSRMVGHLFTLAVGGRKASQSSSFPEMMLPGWTKVKSSGVGAGDLGWYEGMRRK